MPSVDIKDIAFASSVPAIATNGCYVLAKDGLVRITFLESFVSEVVTARVAVAMTVEVLTGVRAAIDECIAGLEKQKIDAATEGRVSSVSLN